MKKHDPSEVLTSLLLQSPDEDGSVEGHTSAELREKTGLSTPTLMNKLHKLDREGRLEVRSVTRKAIDGKLRRFTVYTIKPDGT
jgi:predicted transcriptional regulator